MPTYLPNLKAEWVQEGKYALFHMERKTTKAVVKGFELCILEFLYTWILFWQESRNTSEDLTMDGSAYEDSNDLIDLSDEEFDEAMAEVDA